MSEDDAVPRGFLVVDDHVLDILSGMDGKVLSILRVAFSVSANILLQSRTSGTLRRLCPASSTS
ncbi:hypothetical protein J2744_002875 [Halorubrum trapanicum]|uniref:Uncharacterized protein n=1 Tax=Halorubrum trapanicum TaxID=29284 RepID=A0A8J7R9J2_9EURY|nr:MULTISPECIES: hypothetical protein [Haloferacales]MBP1903171.1 hypothetical protein [Halorubrum trapanicum]